MLKANLVNRSTLMALGILLILACTVRFWQLSASPPGFYVDEAAIAAQTLCIAETGHDVQGTNRPLLTPVLGGGYTTAPFLYPAALWTKLGGSSITSLRAFTAFAGLLTILGIYLLAGLFWKDQTVALLAALLAGISPWALQFSRIFWDPALASFYLVWSLYFFFRGHQFLSNIFAAAGFAAAAYVYPPLRVQLILLLPAAWWLRRRVLGHERKSEWVVGIALVLFCLPLLKMTLTGEIQGRFSMLSVFSELALQSHDGKKWMGLVLFFKNLAAHFSPSYLFISGDSNLRHSTQHFGILSWLEGLGFFLALVLLWQKRLFEKTPQTYWWPGFLLFGIFTGIVPASMTWEGIPHSLRSIGAQPFFHLLAAFALYRFWQYRQSFGYVLIILSFASFARWSRVYFSEYPQFANAWFDAEVVNHAHQAKVVKDISTLTTLHPDYPELAIKYYRMAYFGESCQKTPP